MQQPPAHSTQELDDSGEGGRRHKGGKTNTLHSLFSGQMKEPSPQPRWTMGRGQEGQEAAARHHQHNNSTTTAQHDNTTMSTRKRGNNNNTNNNNSNTATNTATRQSLLNACD